MTSHSLHKLNSDPNSIGFKFIILQTTTKYVTALLTLERSLQFTRLCRSILEDNDQVQLVVIINQKGRIVENKTRDDRVTKGLSNQKKEMLFMECVLQMSMNKDFDSEFGILRYTLSVREEISIFCFSFEDHIIVAFIEPNTNLITTGQDISKIISKFS